MGSLRGFQSDVQADGKRVIDVLGYGGRTPILGDPALSDACGTVSSGKNVSNRKYGLGEGRVLTSREFRDLLVADRHSIVPSIGTCRTTSEAESERASSLDARSARRTASNSYPSPIPITCQTYLVPRPGTSVPQSSSLQHRGTRMSGALVHRLCEDAESNALHLFFRGRRAIRYVLTQKSVSLRARAQRLCWDRHGKSPGGITFPKNMFPRER